MNVTNSNALAVRSFSGIVKLLALRHIDQQRLASVFILAPAYELTEELRVGVCRWEFRESGHLAVLEVDLWW